MKPRVVLADDHVELFDGLRRLLEPHFDVVGTAEDGVALLETVNQAPPDAVVLDISMPRMNGINAAKRLAKEHPQVKIVFLSMHRDPVLVAQALATGASGYVLKISAHGELVNALNEVLAGKRFISSSIQMKIE